MSTAVVGAFEDQLGKAAVLASSIPIVMSMAGNTGIQAATVAGRSNAKFAGVEQVEIAGISVEHRFDKGHVVETRGTRADLCCSGGAWVRGSQRRP